MTVRTTVPVLPMMDQHQGGHSEPSRLFPSPNPYPDLYTRRCHAKLQVSFVYFSPMLPTSERNAEGIFSAGEVQKPRATVYTSSLTETPLLQMCTCCILLLDHHLFISAVHPPSDGPDSFVVLGRRRLRWNGTEDRAHGIGRAEQYARSRGLCDAGAPRVRVARVTELRLRLRLPGFVDRLRLRDGDWPRHCVRSASSSSHAPRHMQELSMVVRWCLLECDHL